MKQIELGDFVSNALIQIAKGVREANMKLTAYEKNQYDVFNLRGNRGDASKIPGIKFDVAVTAGCEQIDKAGFFIALVNIGGGATSEKSNSNDVAHRIQFEVGLEGNWK